MCVPNMTVRHNRKNSSPKFTALMISGLMIAGLAIAICAPGDMLIGSVLADDKKASATLVEVGNTTITDQQLKKALASSPFGIQFNAMGRDEQASLRGVILKRLVSSRLLELEAKAQKLAQSPAFKHDMSGFRKSLLYKKYMDGLRESVQMSKEDLKQMMLEYKNNPDAVTAARSSAVTQRYRALRVLAIQHMRQTYNVRTFEERIKPGITNDTILLQGRNIGLTYGDVIEGHNLDTPPPASWVKERLYQQAEVELVASAASEFDIDVSKQLASYKKERLPGLLRARLVKKWLAGNPDETLSSFYKAHPEVGSVASRWHIGQLVVATKKEADRLRNAIVEGASLFKMAGQFSIDPYGKSRNGDMGWLRKGKAHPSIEKAIESLKEGNVSEVIKTSRGFHLITVLDKRDGEQMRFAAIKDKIHQAFIETKMAEYLIDLQKKYKVVWKILGDKKAPANDKT